MAAATLWGCVLPLFRSPVIGAAPQTLPTRRDRLGLRGGFGTDDHVADDATLLVRATTGSAGAGEKAWGIVAAVAYLESALADHDIDEPVRVWCAGSGGIAEPLTAALFVEAIGRHADVVATDLSPLAAADRGPLSAAQIAWLPRSVRSALAPGPDGFVVGETRNMRIRGVQGDLRAGSPADVFDLVICRDVLHHYRPAVAQQMLVHLRQATAPHGVLLLSAVDGLAAGLPLGSDSVILLDGAGQIHEPVAASLSPQLLLLGLLNDELDDHRSERLATLADAFNLDEARVGAAIAALVAGDSDTARRQHRLLREDDPDHAVVGALIHLHNGRLGEARAALEHAPPTSWLAPWLHATVLVQQHRSIEAHGLCQLALERLAKCGDSTTPVVALMPEYTPHRVKVACLAVLQSTSGRWHRP